MTNPDLPITASSPSPQPTTVDTGCGSRPPHRPSWTANARTILPTALVGVWAERRAASQVRAGRHRAPPTRASATRLARTGHDAERRPGPRVGRIVAATAAMVVFVGGVVAANASTARFGLIPVGLGLTATAGTYAAGLVLLARDWVHDTCGRAAVLAAIAGAGTLSAVLAGPVLAFASATAFVVSELADLLVYQPLRRRGWARAVLASNTVGAVIDTLLFLSVAGFAISLPVFAGQLVGKATTTLIPVTVVVIARAFLRHRVQPTGA